MVRFFARMCILLFFCTAWLSQSLWAQEVATIVKVDSLQPGDLFDYTIIVKGRDTDTELILPDSSAFGEMFEVTAVNRQKPDNQTDSIIYKLQYFGVGTNQIPEVDVKFKKEDQINVIKTDPVPVFYKTLVENPEDPDALQPFKSIYLFSRSNWVLLFTILLILLVVGYVWYRWKKYKETEPALPLPFKLIPFVNPLEELQEELDMLSGHESIKNRDFKQFYSLLSDVIRVYFEDAWQIDALEMTTSDLIRALRNAGVDQILITQTNLVLRQADMVKFAKTEVTVDTCFSDLEKAKSFAKEAWRLDSGRITILKNEHEESMEKARFEHESMQNAGEVSRS